MNKFKYLLVTVLYLSPLTLDYVSAKTAVKSNIAAADDTSLSPKIMITTVYNTNDHDADFLYYGRKVQLAPKSTLKGLNKDAITNLDKGVILSYILDDRNSYENFLTRGDINVPWGVAGLDGDGYVTAPLRPDHIIVQNGMTVGTDTAKNTYAGQIGQTPKLTMFTDQSLDGENVDPYTPWGDLFQIGGLQANDSKFFSVYGNPYGGGNFGAVDIVTMNGMNAGQRAGISAGDVNSIRSYMNFDAVARYTRTGSTPPRFIVSDAVKDPDGVSHTVTFSATGATFNPALPVYWGNMLRKKMHVITNWEGVSSTNLPPKALNARKPIRTYAGEIEDWSTNAKGQITGITVNGWGIFDSKSYGLKDAEAENQIPGVTTVDGSKPALDTDRTNFGKPALMVGVYTKAFDRNTICQINPDDPHGDINNPNGTVGDQVRECEGEELDLWQYNKKDYDSSFHGYTIAMGVQPGASQKLTTDSFGQWISGGNALPTLLRLTGGYWDHGVSIEGDGYQINVPYVVGKDVGNVQVSNSFSQPTENGVTSIWSWKGYRDKIKEDGDWDGNSQHLQYKEGGSLTDEAGAIGGQLVFNPTDKVSNNSYHYGVGLGAGGSFQFPQYGIIVDEKGQSWFPHGGAVNNGEGLGFIPSSGDGAGHPFIYASSENKLNLKTSAGGMSDIEASIVTADNGVNILNGQGLGIIPSSGDEKGHPYLTAKDYNTLISMYSDGKSVANFETGDLKVDNSLTVTNNLTVGNTINASNGINILNGQGIGFVPLTGDSMGHPFLASDGTNNGVKLMYSDGKSNGNLSLGYLSANNSIDIIHGSLGLYPDAGDNEGHPIIHSTAYNSVDFRTTVNNDYSNIAFRHFTSTDGGEIINGQGLGFIPTTGDSQGHPYLTSGDYYYLKLMYSDGKTYASLKADSVTLNNRLGLTVDDSDSFAFLQGVSNTQVNLKNTDGNYVNLTAGSTRYMNSEGYVDINSSNGNTINLINSNGSKANLNSGGITIYDGQGLGIIPSSGDGAGHPYLTSTASDMMNLKTSAGGKGDLTVRNIYADNIISTGTGSSSDLLKDIGSNTLQLTYTDKTSLANLYANDLKVKSNIIFKSGSNTDSHYSSIQSTDPSTISFINSDNGNTSLANTYFGDSTSNNSYIEPNGKLNFNLDDGSYVGFNAVDNVNVELHNSLNGWANLSLWQLKAHGGIDIDNGNGLGFIPSSGDNGGHPFFVGTSGSDLYLNKTSGGLANLYVNTINGYVSGSVTVPDNNVIKLGNDTNWIQIWAYPQDPNTLLFNTNNGGVKMKGIKNLEATSIKTYSVTTIPNTLKSSSDATYPPLIAKHLEQGTQMFCTNCSSKSFPGISNTQSSGGLPVWWNGKVWVDSLGQEINVNN